MSAPTIPPLFGRYLRELAPRLTDDEALRLATVIDETPESLSDPRVATDLVALIYSLPTRRLLVAWPDGAMGFARFESSSQSGPVLLAAYAAARGWLEEFHVQHAAPAGAAH